MLVTHEAWEKKSAPFGILYREEKIRYYPYFEVSKNVELFHIDIQKKGRKRTWSRYIVADIFDVISFLHMKDTQELRISLQVPRTIENSRSYEMLAITEILEACDEKRQQAFIYRCSDGSSYVRSILTTKEEDLVEKRLVYLCQ